MKDLNFYYEHAISINDFLEMYYGKTDFKEKKLVHENVKSLFPDIMRGSFEDIVKNSELVYTGKVILVKDCNNKCIPYLNNFEFDINECLDDRERLIVELVSAIDKIINNNNNNGLIILENNDSISNNVIGSTSREISIVDDEFVKLNNDGGILIRNIDDICTFEYLITKLINFSLASYSRNDDNASDLSKEKDIISISLKSSGSVFITFNGNTCELTNLLDIRNYLLKYYYPRKEELLCSDLNIIELDSLMDFQLEHLKKIYKQEKNYKMYFRVNKELSRRYKEKKKESRNFRREKEKIKVKKMEE